MRRATCLYAFVLVLVSASAGASAQSESFDTVRQKADAARTAGRLEEAIALYSRAVRTHPDWAEGYWYLGTAYYEREEFAGCRGAFERLLQLQAGNGAGWAFKGLCDFRLKQYREALSDLTRGHTLGVGDQSLIPVARYHRAILLARFEEYDAATHTLAAFAAEGNGSPMVIEAMGLAALRMPLLPEDLPAGKRDMVTLAGRATFLAASNSMGAADEQFKQLVRRYPDTPNVHYLYGVFLLYDHAEEALAEFKEELRVSPSHAPAMVQIAQELLKRGDPGTAMQWASKAVQIAPANFFGRRVLGQIKLESNDVPGAIADLEAAVKLQPDSPSVHYTLARAYQRAGRAADARREREEFSRLEKLQQEERGAVVK